MMSIKDWTEPLSPAERREMRDEQERWNALEARVKVLEDALRPFATYARARARMPLGGMGNSVHAIHTGTEFAADITVDHVNNALRVLNDEAALKIAAEIVGPAFSKAWRP